MIIREPFGHGALGEIVQRPKIYNLARMTTETTGTGMITLDAASKSLLSFDRAGVKDGELISYGIEDGVDREIGYGIYDATAKTLTREQILKSTKDDGPLDLSGKAEIAIVPAAEDIGGAIGPRGPEGPHGDPGAVPDAPSGMAGHLRRNGAWLPMTVLRATLHPPRVYITPMNTFVDGPTVDVGNVGTWFITADVSVYSDNAAYHFVARLWDGTTVIADASATTGAIWYGHTFGLAGFITDPAGPLRVSCAAISGAAGTTFANDFWTTPNFLGYDPRFNLITAIRIG